MQFFNSFSTTKENSHFKKKFQENTKETENLVFLQKQFAVLVKHNCYAPRSCRSPPLPNTKLFSFEIMGTFIKNIKPSSFFPSTLI